MAKTAKATRAKEVKPFRHVSCCHGNTKKMRNFVCEPMGNKSVNVVPGIGLKNGRYLRCKGIKKVIKLIYFINKTYSKGCGKVRWFGGLRHFSTIFGNKGLSVSTAGGRNEPATFR